MKPNEESKPVTISEVKNILKKIEKEREELTYEQRIALEHAQKFSNITVKKTQDLVKELMKIENMEETHAYKIADIQPKTEDDVKAVYAKERATPSQNDIKKILDIVKKYIEG